MKFVLEVAMNNVAFMNDYNGEPELYELASILRKLADNLEDQTPIPGPRTERVMDVNGNVVGHYGFPE